MIDGRIEKIVLIGEPKEVLLRAYSHEGVRCACSGEELWRSFCNVITADSFNPARVRVVSSDYPSYMPQLFASIVVASADSDSISDGNFRTRLSKRFNLAENQVQNLSIISKFWFALKGYLERYYKCPIYLVLPDVGRETQIGISKNIVVPTFLDFRHLSLFLSNLNNRETEDLLVYDVLPSGFLSSVRTDTPHKFSENLKAECRKYRDNQSNLLLPIIKQIVANIKYIPYQRNNETVRFQYVELDSEEYIKICRIGRRNQDMGDELVPVEKFLSGSLLNNLQLSKTMNRQLAEEGAFAFVLRGCSAYYEYSQLLPSRGNGILFIHASNYYHLEPYIQRFVRSGKIGGWFKVKIGELAYLKKEILCLAERENILEYLERKSVFRLWLEDSIRLRGFYISRIKKYLFSKYYYPMVSSNRDVGLCARSNGTNHQSIKCELEYRETHCCPR